MSAPSLAFIMGAGLGSRLKDRTKDMPKGFLDIDGKALVVRSVEKLLKSGIEHVMIGTGYHANVYEEAFAGWPVSFVLSDRYATTGSMYTLYNARSKIDRGFLLLESDLLYDIAALEALMHDPRADIVLASGFTGSEDEVWIETDDAGMLKSMSKDKTKLARIDAELVGISKVSLSTYACMCALMESSLESFPKLDYEYALVHSSLFSPIPVLKINDLAWCEIDDENHLARAMSRVYPRIKDQ